MDYKGYTSSPITPDGDTLHGEVAGIRDVVTFEGQTAATLASAFRASVDDYLAMCAERGEEPNAPETAAPVAWEKEMIAQAELGFKQFCVGMHTHDDGQQESEFIEWRDAFAHLKRLYAASPAPASAPTAPDVPWREALRTWRTFWHTPYSDALILTGAQADALCDALSIPFDADEDAAPASGEQRADMTDADLRWVQELATDGRAGKKSQRETFARIARVLAALRARQGETP